MERCERPLIGGVDACVVLNQQGGYVHVLDRGEEVEVRKRKDVAMTGTERMRQKIKEERCKGVQRREIRNERRGGKETQAIKANPQERICEAR